MNLDEPPKRRTDAVFAQDLTGSPALEEFELEGDRDRLIIEQRRLLEALSESEARLAADLADARQLQEISTKLIQQDDPQALYDGILSAAITIMKSDMGSMQMLYPDRRELFLLSSKGFSPDAVRFWQWVRTGGASSCSMALKTSGRCVVPDVETCDFMAGTADLDAYRQADIRALQSTPLVSRNGRAVGMISTHWHEPHQPSERALTLLDVLARQAADLIERKQAEERQALLANELNHRVKNTLAIVQALAQQSFRGADLPEEPRRAFEGRLQALASTHDLLTREDWEPTDLAEIVTDSLKACGVRDRATVDGAPLRIGPRTAVTLAMALHELCTNAIKYGALSVDEGRVSLSWTIESAPVSRLVVRWEETGGPAVTPPEQRGFGSRMIERALAGELKAKVEMDFRREGLRCTIVAPLASLMQSPAAEARETV
jgi:two-component sensor histidine kinase